MSLPLRDRTVVQDLAKEIADLASLPVQRQKRDMWADLNDLRPVRPMVYTFMPDVPWHEMDVDGELAPRASDEFCRWDEMCLRRLLYQWKHMRGDTVVEPVVECGMAISDSGFGIDFHEEIAVMDPSSPIMGHAYYPQLETDGDVDRIRTPVVRHDAARTEDILEKTLELFGSTLAVEKRGQPGFWFAPWDDLIRWWGVQEALVDMVRRPALMHMAIGS